MLDRKKIIRLQEDYRLERFGDEITIYHPTLATSIYLNDSGALVWELCDGRRSVAEIIATLVELYPESRAQIPDETVMVIEQLVEHGIAVLIEP